MATPTDVRRIALSLPETAPLEGRFGFTVRHGTKRKGFVWVWLERVAPKKGRVPNPAVVAVRVADLSDKEMLLASDDEKFFTEPHYNGYPAVLVRLAAIGVDELAELITAAWRCQAPRALVAQLAGGATRRAPKARASKAGAKRRPVKGPRR